MNNELITSLRKKQNPDGGWTYGHGSSWTEPTAMALIALNCCYVRDSTVRSGIEFLLRTQRDDGGWAPKPGVNESTWVTSLVLLIPGLAPEVQRRGLAWIAGQKDRSSWFTERLRTFLAGSRPELSNTPAGWSFFPGTAGWVTPTSLAILALRRNADPARNANYSGRISSGCEFLISRRCPDGGWNHGSSRALGYDLSSYPETTGQALLALKDSNWPDREKTYACAEQHLARAGSVEAVAWLQLGLSAHGRRSTGELPRPKNTMDRALALMAGSAGEGGKPFEL